MKFSNNGEKSPEFDESTINTKEDGEPELKEWESRCHGLKD